MARTSISDQEALGAAILERLADTKVPAFLKPTVTAFGEIQRALEKASIAAADARASRDDALLTIADADDALDVAVMSLADTLVASKLGTRKNPFDGFSKHAPAAMCALGYAREVQAVRKLLRAIGKKKGAPKKELADVSKLADEVEKALAAIAKPQAQAQKAMGKRDALLLDWQKSLGRLRKLAAAAWVDDEETFRAIFAAPESVVTAAPKKHRGKPTKPAPGKADAPSPATK